MTSIRTKMLLLGHLWSRMSCLRGGTVRAKVRGFECIVFFPFPVYIYVNNGAKFRMFTYSDKFGAQIFLEP